MGVLIDASVLIEHERAGLDLEAETDGRDDEFFLSVVTASELLHGVHRAEAASVRARRSAFVEAVLAGFPLLDIDVATARAHARLGAELAASDRKVGAHDLWLAASCLAHGLSLATLDRRDFARIPGLSVEVWGR
ncbi:MAG: PIN domain-containing protein [Gemmatimonadota bacterium]|nr:PIN domain-containing protein [Gemmatimonadota bacterium]